MLARHDMTVTSVIGPRGEIWQLDTQVGVKAGQWLYCGSRLDGTPVVSVASDTPTFDRMGYEQLCQGPDLLGIVTADAWAPANNVVPAPANNVVPASANNVVPAPAVMPAVLWPAPVLVEVQPEAPVRSRFLDVDDTVDEDEDAFDVIYRVVARDSGFHSNIDRRERIPA